MRGSTKPWVLFRHGTCVLPEVATGDLRELAIDLMRTWGPVVPGTSAGDFNVVKLADHPGWLVTCHHDAILTYVGTDDLADRAASEVVIGLIGRSKRDQDAKELRVIHVQPEAT
jgi:hypothetical protein